MAGRCSKRDRDAARARAERLRTVLIEGAKKNREDIELIRHLGDQLPDAWTAISLALEANNEAIM